MAKQKKILIVDDSSYQRFRAKKVLSENEFKVYEAEDGIDAVRYIRKINPAALVIMFSALDDERTVMESIKAGAKDYIVKPLKPDLMLNTVKKFLKME